VPIGGRRGRPLSRPGRVYADRGYDHDKYRRALHERSIPTSIARRGHPHGSGLGKSVGLSSVHMPGCIISVVYVFASNVALTFTKRSSN
jgi:IS5 family transposase